MKTSTVICLFPIIGEILVVGWQALPHGSDGHASIAPLNRSSVQEVASPIEAPAKSLQPSFVTAPVDSDDRDEVSFGLRMRLTDPARREIDLLQAKTMIGRTNGRLFLRLSKTTPETLDRLKTILAETDLARRIRSTASDAANDVTPEAYAAMRDTQRQELRQWQLGQLDQYLAITAAGILHLAVS